MQKDADQYMISVAKWERDIVFDIAHEWTKYFQLPFKTTRDSSVIWFQLRLLHRLLQQIIF